MGGHYYALRETLSYNRGRHSVKMGGEFSLDKILHYVDLNNYGVFSFDGSKSGNALADYLLGVPRTMNQDAPINKIDNGWYYGLYVEDDFRIHPRLTLNIGLRYDLQLPMTDPQNRKLTFVPGVQSMRVPSAPLGLLFAGDPGVGRGMVSADTNNFAPRLGLAWDPIGDGKTSVRAAFGVFYGGISGNAWNQVADRQPFSARQQFSNVHSLTDPYADMGGNPFPYVFNPASPRFLAYAAISGVSLNFKWPSGYQMNFSVQRQLTKDLSVMAAYVGSIGHKYPFQYDVNYPLPGPTATASNYNDRRPYDVGALSNVYILQSMMNSAYHGLQIMAEKRMSRTFSFKGFYTFSKSIDGADLENGQIQGSAENENRLYLDRGRSSNDRTHNFVTSVIWQLDYLHGGNPLLRALARDWSISAIIAFRSGAPLSITTGRDTNMDGNSNDRADLVGNPFLDPNRSRNATMAMWFNTAAFVSPANGQDGNAGRSILDGPGSKNVNVGIFRDFKLHESWRLQFRSEITNAFNYVNLNNPTTSMNSSTFGQITGAGAMRQIQLGLRLNF